MLNGLRGQVRLQTDGQLKTGRDIISMALLGAEEFAFGTTALIVLGCVMMRKCHSNTCPVGVATQDPKLRAHFRGHYKYVVNYFRFLAQEVREYLADMGFTRLEDIVGRTDLIELHPVAKGTKASLLDFSRMLCRMDSNAALHHCTEQKHDIAHVKDVEMLAAATPALESRREVSLEYAIGNTDRAVGAMLSGAVATRYGNDGLPDGTISVKFKGSAGQSFGAFLARGISFKLEGEANDYLGPERRTHRRAAACTQQLCRRTEYYRGQHPALWCHQRRGLHQRTSRRTFRRAQLGCHRGRRGRGRSLL